jgi:hypothetical protein
VPRGQQLECANTESHISIRDVSLTNQGEKIEPEIKENLQNDFENYEKTKCQKKKKS